MAMGLSLERESVVALETVDRTLGTTSVARTDVATACSVPVRNRPWLGESTALHKIRTVAAEVQFWGPYSHRLAPGATVAYSFVHFNAALRCQLGARVQRQNDRSLQTMRGEEL
jgi:hypothetical protein